jgi:ribonuclease HII
MIAGVDEVGRGALAGPLVAAAVVLPRCGNRGFPRLAGLNDSKVLSAAQRESWSETVRSAALSVGIGIVEVDELDEIGLSAANRIAMERAALALDPAPDVLLLDAAVTELPLPQVGIINGDARCLSIAAASVIAKVARDRIMVELDAVEDRYGFALHKGYGTAFHLAALREHGPGPMHRRCFAPVSTLLNGT